MTTYPPISDWRIKINGMEHGVPHVHVEFRDGSRVVVAIETCEILAGNVTPPSALRQRWQILPRMPRRICVNSGG
ncbi:MAG: DUF4160 domain-containing protein [Azonexus sp.]|jgi:hypothetical protein|nr:DUF4160 domain-containing protein [Azonexus sp.]